MSLESLLPISESAMNHLDLAPDQVIGKSIILHTESFGFPSLKDVKIGIIGVTENRNAFFPTLDYDLDSFRNSFYNLFPGNWKFKLADLGNLPNGNSVKDTYYAISEICKELNQQNIITIIIGGSHDIIYPIYKSYSSYNKLVNIVSIDNQFDFSQEEELISGRSYMSQIIMEEPNYLHNFTNLGYQSFFISQEELDLMEKLYFEHMRLGKVLDDVSQTEPHFRDADIVGIDMKSLSWTATGTNTFGQANGIDSRSICSLARYSGISDRVSSFGVFELPSSPVFHQLLSQIIWYFIEGYSLRFGEYPINTNDGFTKYIVTLSGRELVFYNSEVSKRWWVELTNENFMDNKLKRTTLLPCTKQDYDTACADELPDRWWKASRRG
ncbi:MAG: arginase [Flavobacteriales bacterium]|nr:arginase [Flavobacteriales bacterium]|tara:strand:+ start:3310 stop:4458 length:1149 start_codon:yes stop_codon:yes gene_type:complete